MKKLMLCMISGVIVVLTLCAGLFVSTPALAAGSFDWTGPNHIKVSNDYTVLIQAETRTGRKNVTIQSGITFNLDPGSTTSYTQDTQDNCKSSFAIDQNNKTHGQITVRVTSQLNSSNCFTGSSEDVQIGSSNLAGLPGDTANNEGSPGYAWKDSGRITTTSHYKFSELVKGNVKLHTSDHTNTYEININADFERKKDTSDYYSSNAGCESVISDISVDKSQAKIIYRARNNGACTSSDKKDITITDIKNADLPSTATDDGGILGCTAGVLTFLVCPAVIMAAKSVDEFKSILQDLLKVPLVSSNADIYNVWKNMRNFADVIFVLVFLVVIFGSTLGIDNYTLKKTLPRVIAAAILIQISFWLTAFVVDIGNIAGGGMEALARGVGIGPPTFDFASASDKAVGLVGILALEASLGAAVFALSFTAVITALIALLIIILVLVARQVIILTLIVTAPLAIAAWILPNTEKVFKLWYKTLFQMVLLYPIIMFLFVAGRLFAEIAQKSQVITGGFGPALAVMAYVVPLLLVPYSFKFAGTLMTATSNGIGKAGAKLNGKFGSGSAGDKARLEARQLNNANRLADPKSNAFYAGAFGRAVARKRGGYGGFGSKIPVVGKIPGFAQSNAERKAQDSNFDKYNKNQQDLYAQEYRGYDSDKLVDVITDEKSNQNQRIAAVNMLVKTGQFDKLHEAQQELEKSEHYDSQGRAFATIYAVEGEEWQKLMSPHRRTITGAGDNEHGESYAWILMHIRKKNSSSNTSQASPPPSPTGNGSGPQPSTSGMPNTGGAHALMDIDHQNTSIDDRSIN